MTDFITVDQAKEKLGCRFDYQLGEVLAELHGRQNPYHPNVVSRWRKNGGLPAKHTLKIMFMGEQNADH